MNEIKIGFPQIGDWNSFIELENMQNEYIECSLNNACNSNFYKELVGNYHNNLNLQDFPVVSKKHLRDAYPFGFLAVPKERLSSYHESSGTTGRPSSSYFTDNDWDDIVSRFSRSRVNITEKDTIMIKTPYAMLTTSHQMHRTAQAIGATILPADNRSAITSYPRIIRLLHDIQVSVAWSMPTELLFWAKTAKMIGYDPKVDFPFLHDFLVAGEPLSQKKKDRIQSIWGDTKISQDYGSTETGSLAGECPYGNLHLWADRFIFELYDGKGGTLKNDGEGQLVVSSLFREAMPLIRYNLGDYVRISYTSCKCNWKLPKIEVIGRNNSPIVQQNKLFSHRLEELIYNLPEENEIYFWRGKYSKDELIVELETSTNRTNVESTLKSDIKEHLHIDAKVNVVPLGTLVPSNILLHENTFTKPKFLFNESEDWSKAILY